MIQKWLSGLVLLSVITGCAGLEVGGDFSSGRRALMSGDSATAVSYFMRVAQRDPSYVAPFSSFRESIWTYLGRAQYQSGKLAEAKSSFEKALSQVPGDSVAKLYLGLTNVRLQSTQKATNPFTLQEISFALREKVDPKRVAALARERGVDFDLTTESENQLKKAGADDFLLDQIKKIRAETKEKKNQVGDAGKEIAAGLTGIRDQLDYLNNSRSGLFWDPKKEIRAQIQTGLALLSAPQPDWQKVLSTGEWVAEKLEEEIDLARRDESQEYRRQEQR
jgi:tetratricopeptide (TPR) repeat protein